MNAVTELINNLLAVDFDGIDAEVIRDHADLLTQLNRDQLDKGLDADGKSLGQYASIKYKGRLRPVDLLQSGAFRGGFGYDTETGAFIATSSDPKTGFLQANYSDNIVGLPEDKYEVLQGILFERYVTAYRNGMY